MSQDLLSWDPFAPVAQPPPQAAPPQDDDDEFGDFEEAPSAPEPSRAPEPVAVPQAKPPPMAGHSMAQNLSPQKKKPLIQDSINDMGALSPGQSIKFGQHLNHGSKSSADWNGILGARPGDRRSNPPQHSRQESLNKPQTKKPTPQTKTPTSQPQNNAFDWDDFETTSPTTKAPAAAPATNLAPFRAISTPHQLLTYLHANCLPVMDKLVQQLQPLTFPLRKRVLAHPTTKKFVERYIDLVYLAARVMAGRMRKLRIMCENGIEGMSKTTFSDLMKKSDMDAREIMRVWKPLSAAIGPMTNHRQLPVLQPDFLIANEDKAPTQLDSVCCICGLKNTEFIRGHPKPKFNAQQNAHFSCMSWYNNLSVFGVNGVRRAGAPSFTEDLI
ncbi:hypothetical protein CJU89_0517 [Yarrowia sp. B02]|nr:hypothetical protein CJU89_0517 [Yarrowia sp. B02]